MTRSEKFIFCTIITENYFPFAMALHESLCAFYESTELFILISDKSEASPGFSPTGCNNDVKILYYDQVCESGEGKTIFEKYHKSHHDAFRWAMKPVLLQHILSLYEKVIYVDCDIHFYHDYKFLFELLDQWSLLLSPHFRSIDPSVDYDNYIMQFNNGIYNGGFIGARRDAAEPLSWWAKVCVEICEVDPCKGQFVDQSHLNLIPVYFENIHILRHRGCNVANWNQVECKRVPVGDSVWINGYFPIVFIHFTKSTVRGIVGGTDALLRPFLEMYLDRLKPHGVTLDWILPPPAKMAFFKKMNPLYVGRAIKHRLRRIGLGPILIFCLIQSWREC